MPSLNRLAGKPANTLWVFPLLAGLVPAAAVFAALFLSASLASVPTCNPFIDGCVSISRTARQGLPNQVFRMLMLPGAVLQGQTWLLAWLWLKGLGANPRGTLRVLPWLGLSAAAFLVVYAGLLGTGGPPYRWMRLHGILIYFGATYLCMLITALHLRRLARAGAIRVPARAHRLLLLLCVLTLAMWLTQTFLRPFLDDRDLRKHLTNMLEWYAGLAYLVFFLGLAWVWRHMRFTVQLGGKG